MLPFLFISVERLKWPTLYTHARTHAQGIPEVKTTIMGRQRTNLASDHVTFPLGRKDEK